jgi:hypothetical protein
MTPDCDPAAVLKFSDIKAAVEDFDRGDSNLFTALERIRIAISQLATDGESRGEAA